MGIKATFGKFVNKVRASFQTSYVTDAKAITTDLVKSLIEQSNFGSKHPFEVVDQLYCLEPDIGGAVDRLSSLAQRSFDGFECVGTDKQHIRCQELANKFSKELKLPALVESWTEQLLIFGTLLIDKKSLKVLPLKKVSVFQKEVQSLTEVITDPDEFIVDENMTTEQKYSKKDVYHVKYKETPMYLEDIKGRLTWGVFGPSPTYRLIYSKWWQRQAMIIDIMWRWRMVPREHHKIMSALFDPSKYTGTTDERRAAAKTDATQTINTYIASLNAQMPDSGYVTTDNIAINMVEPNVKFTSPNDLITQFEENVWKAMNTPEAIVSGSARTSYASALIMASFMGIRVESMIEKLDSVLLDIVMKKILMVDNSLPVYDLRTVYEFEIEATKIERFRASSIMGSLGCFSAEEIRERAGFKGSLPTGQIYWKMATTKPPGTKGAGDVARDVESGITPYEPETPESDEDHRSSSGKNKEVNP